MKLKIYGFKNVEHKTLDEGTFTLKRWQIAGYGVLAKGTNTALGWRILMEGIDASAKKKVILKSYAKTEDLASNLPKDFIETHTKNADTLHKILTKAPSEIRQIGNSTIEKLMQQVVEGKKAEREVFVDQLIAENKGLPRPLGSLDITVCNILGSKGLGADVVFLIGFDQGKLPAAANPTDSEIYQFLVALTRAKKRIYLIHTGGKQISQFVDYIKTERIEIKN
jgi:superfamily I DNA/RNA helicase